MWGYTPWIEMAGEEAPALNVILSAGYPDLVYLISTKAIYIVHYKSNRPNLS